MVMKGLRCYSTIANLALTSKTMMQVLVDHFESIVRFMMDFTRLKKELQSLIYAVLSASHRRRYYIFELESSLYECVAIAKADKARLPPGVTKSVATLLQISDLKGRLGYFMEKGSWMLACNFAYRTSPRASVDDLRPLSKVLHYEIPHTTLAILRAISSATRLVS